MGVTVTILVGDTDATMGIQVDHDEFPYVRLHTVSLLIYYVVFILLTLCVSLSLVESPFHQLQLAAVDASVLFFMHVKHADISPARLACDALPEEINSSMTSK
eukprot:147644-Amphidinium_carterae.2